MKFKLLFGTCIKFLNFQYAKNEIKIQLLINQEKFK